MIKNEGTYLKKKKIKNEVTTWYRNILRCIHLFNCIHKCGMCDPLSFSKFFSLFSLHYCISPKENGDLRRCPTFVIFDHLINQTIFGSHVSKLFNKFKNWNISWGTEHPHTQPKNYPHMWRPYDWLLAFRIILL